MSNLEAINLAEGLTEAQTEEEYFAAWQHLIDSGLAWNLQGWFGRTAMRYIEMGVCKHPEAEKNPA